MYEEGKSPQSGGLWMRKSSSTEYMCSFLRKEKLYE
jgi:hypothetical protein